ncbi:hypothetical protein G9A89_019321 [Geosiphon pyriformis]|nr:hypothetical protein G9A89_019321 [Geosiphon pyriformis]
MTTTRAKSKKAAPDICPKISNKISTRGALSVVEATRQNVLEVFPLPSNRKRLPLVATESTSPSLAGFSPVKVPSKRHTWVSPSVASIPTKSPKVFNNRPVNKLVFPSIDSTPGASDTTSLKKMVKKTKSSEKWGQSLASAIVTPNLFVVPNEILDEISAASSSMSSKIGQDQPLAVLPNMVFSSRSSLVLEAKQSPSVGSPVLGNWTDQMKTESSSPLVSGATFGGAWETITSRQRFAEWVASTLVPGATFKTKLAYVKTVFQSVHGFLGAKSVLKDNVKLFCVEFASQQSLEALTSSVRLATLKIAKSLVVSEFGSSSAAVVLCDISLGVSTADIKLAFSVFGSVTHVVLKSAGIWQYVVVYFEKLDSAVSALKHWSVLVGKDSVRILPLVNQNETILFHDKFKAKLVNLPPGCTAFEISDMIFQIGGRTCFIPRSSDSGHHFQFALVTFGSQGDLNSAIVRTGTLRKCHIWWETPGCWCCFRCQEMGHLAIDCKISPPPTPKIPKVFKSYFVGSASYAKTAASSGLSEFPPLVASLAASVVDPAVGSRLDSLEKQISDLAALVKSIVEPVGSLVALVSCLLDDNAAKADIACLRPEVDFGDMDYDDMLAAKPSFLSKDTIECVIALWRMSGAETRGSIESTKLFLSEFIFDSRNLNGIIERIHGLGLFPPTFDSAYHLNQSGQHYAYILTETKSPIPKKNAQDLQKPKQIPKASAIPSNLITSADNPETKPETEMRIKPSAGIRPFFSINTQCLAQINQMSFLKARQIDYTKSAILTPAILESWKTEIAF